jgi:hypothetical protein
MGYMGVYALAPAHDHGLVIMQVGSKQRRCPVLSSARPTTVMRNSPPVSLRNVSGGHFAQIERFGQCGQIRESGIRMPCRHSRRAFGVSALPLGVSFFDRSQSCISWSLISATNTGTAKATAGGATCELIAGNPGQQNYLVVKGVVILISAINP